MVVADVVVVVVVVVVCACVWSTAIIEKNEQRSAKWTKTEESGVGNKLS